MNLSNRLEKISNMITEVESVVDVGTDHAYVPIYLVNNNIIKSAIASDINKGPVKKAEDNVKRYNLQSKIECRLGGGLTTIKPCEVEAGIIAGMGGNLIRDIIEERMNVFKSLKYLIVQPVQNPEVLREYIYKSKIEIIDEAVIKEDNKFYEILKIRYSGKDQIIDPIYYEISKILVERKDSTMKEYLEFKLRKYNSICSTLTQNTESAIKRKKELYENIKKIEEFLLCF